MFIYNIVSATKYFYLRHLGYWLAILLTPLFGVFLLISSVQAVIMTPLSNVSGIVSDQTNGQPLAGVTVAFHLATGTLTDVTDNQGKYEFLNIDCFDPIEAVVEESGYQTYEETFSIPCFSTLDHDITLTPESVVADPVVIIPGIMASWNAYQLNGLPGAADEWQLDPIMHTYDQLVDDLQIYGGYILGQDLFTFPYDWRNSNVANAALLADKIQVIKQQTGASRVDIVAHSMGGLLARYYISGPLYQDNVDQVIFIATPQRGAPKSYLAWEGGYTGVTLDADFVKELLLSQMATIAGYDSVFDYVRSYPISSVAELLPDYAYLINKDTQEIIPYSPDSPLYPQNDFLLDLNQPAAKDLFGERVRESTIIYNSNSGDTPVSYEIVPYNQSSALWEHGYPDGFDALHRTAGVNLGPGDTTVPTISSTGLSVDRTIQKYDVKHMSIVSHAISNILDILKGVYAPIQVIDQPDDYLLIQVYSPIEVLLIDPDGRRLGADFANTTANWEEIPGAYYSGYGAQMKFILVPNPKKGQYDLLTQGTAPGHFKIKASLASDQGVAASTTEGQTTTGKQLPYSFSLADYGVAELVPLDQEPPQISIFSPQNKQYLHSAKLAVEYSIEDKESGVFATAPYFDGKEYQLPEIDFFQYHLGEHSFLVQASDYAGNRSEQAVDFEIIATFASLRSDIRRLFREGEIKSKKARDFLLWQVGLAEKWYNKFKGHPSWLPAAARQKWLDKLANRLLRHYQRQGLISERGRQMIVEQLEYLFNH